MEDTGKTIALIKAFGGSGGALPPITAADDGKVLTANSGVWGAQEPIGKKFIVTLTPTALDYSGTMDKTPQEITAAYYKGENIVFALGEYEFPYISAELVGDYYAIMAMFIDTTNQSMITLRTSSEDNTYSTFIYGLTPAT